MMADGDTVELPLFPLGLVLLPGEMLPLHIFEERYKHLIAECRASGDPFGVVLAGSEGMTATGCAARVVGVLQEFADGRSNIVVQGGERFRVVDLHPPEQPDLLPLRATVAYFEDEGGEERPELEREAEQLFARTVEILESEPPEPEAGGLPTSYAIARALELELPVKQRLLQLQDEGRRLELVVEYLRTLLPRLEVWRSRKDAIRGNGKAT